MKSDRALWIIFFLTLSVVLFILFLLFGQRPSGPAIDPTSSPDFSDLGEFNEDEPASSRIYSSPFLTQSNSSGSSKSSIAEDLDTPTSGYYGEVRSAPIVRDGQKRSAKFHPSLKEGFIPRTRLSIEKRQVKLRKRLLEKGFKNEQYIKMQLMALDDETAESTMAKAHELAEKGRVEAALELLKQELDGTDPANLEVRGLLIQTIVGLATYRGYPDTASNYMRQLIAIRTEVNNIKMNTILINNPIAMDTLKAEREALNLWQANPNAATEGMEKMKKNRGFSKETWTLMRGASLGMMTQFTDPKASTEIPKAFRSFEARINENWANPKE